MKSYNCRFQRLKVLTYSFLIYTELEETENTTLKNVVTITFNSGVTVSDSRVAIEFRISYRSSSS